MLDRLRLFRSAALHVSTGEAVRPHATQAFKLVVGVDCDLRITWNGTVERARAVLVSPYTVQAMDREGVAVVFFADPGTHGVPYPRGHAPLVLPDARTTASLVGLAREVALGRGAGDSDALALDDALALVSPSSAGRFHRRGPSSASATLDRRVARALEEAAQRTDATVEEIAARCRLSPVRLRHLVHESTGLSLRSHRLWHRTIHGIEGAASGATIAAAAHHAGFTDHAHFTRSFARFFGRTPSSLPRDVAVLAPWCERGSARIRYR